MLSVFVVVFLLGLDCVGAAPLRVSVLSELSPVVASRPALARSAAAGVGPGAFWDQHGNVLTGLRAKDASAGAVQAEVCKELRASGSPVVCAHPAPARLAETFLAKRGGVRATRAEVEPVILLPGLGGSALEARLDKSNSPAWYCLKQRDWFRLWLPLTQVLTQTCWFDNLAVHYNETTRDFEPPAGVETRTMDFGGVSGMDYLDYILGFPVPFTGYFRSLIASLEAAGLVRGETLFGAPFDWRVPTTTFELDQEQFFARFADLVATARAKNGGKKVHLVSHSLGGLVALRFLNAQTNEWLEENIASFMPISAPFAGAPKALRAVLSGDDFGIELLGWSPINLRQVAQATREAGGVIQLVPNSLFTQGAVVEGPDGTAYTPTSSGYNALFDDAGAPESGLVYRLTASIIPRLLPPRVRTHCIYGVGLPTEIFYNYSRGFDNQPTISFDHDGDGTVPIESLQRCQQWQVLQPQPVDHVEFDLRGHVDILEDEDVFNYIIGQVVTTA